MVLNPDITGLQAQNLVAKYDQELAARLGSHPTVQSMIDLQVLINKRNEAHERQSEILRKQQEALNGIINNMR